MRRLQAGKVVSCGQVVFLSLSPKLLVKHTRFLFLMLRSYSRKLVVLSVN